MQKIFLLLITFSVFAGQNQKDKNIDFQRFFVKKDIIKINFNNKIIISTDIVRIFQDSTLLIADKNEKLIFRYDINGKLLIQFKVKGNRTHIDDIIVDPLGNFYTIDGYENILKKFNQRGEEIKKIRIKNGQQLYLTNKMRLLVYDVYHPEAVKNKPIIHEYTLDGKYIHSFGKAPQKPKIGILSLAAGNISFSDSKIFVCHASDYIIDVYNSVGVFIKRYNNKPSFYYMPETINSLDEKEMKKWNRTVQLWSSYLLEDDYLISYFNRVDETKHWLFIQNDKSCLEMALPSTLCPIGVINKKVFFLDIAKNKNNDNSVTIVIYEFKDHLRQ